MYLGIDTGGTKTLVASLDDNGVIQEEFRFPTPQLYSEFLKKLAESIDNLATKDFIAAGMAIPGRIDRQRGIGLAFGNLPWKNIPIVSDLKKIVNCPVVIDNDANLAGLSEAMLLKQYEKVLYVTISTGIGTGFIVNQKIDAEVADSEGGDMMLEHNGKVEAWEKFASGSAIVRQFGKQAREIEDKETWQIISHNIALGLVDLMAILEPEVIVLGGSVSSHFEKFEEYLKIYIDKYRSPLVSSPLIQVAARPEQAVVYGCYDLAKSIYGYPA